MVKKKAKDSPEQQEASERRTDDQITHDRALIAKLYLQGWLQKDIAVELGLSLSTINRDLKALREEWRTSAKADIDELIAQLLAIPNT
jgi:DNA-binding NarL/FixJ family response regulator